MSLLALLGLRYPVQLLPVLVFESLWKVIWLAAVGIPYLMAGDMDAEMRSVFFNVSLVVIILAVAAQATKPFGGRSVRGYWRRHQHYKTPDGQWAEKQIYIGPYVKGPESAPLVVTKKVNDLIR